MISRRTMSWLLGVSVLAIGALALARPAAGQAPSQPPLTMHRIAGNLFLVKGGSGANTAFYITKNEVFAIDAKMSVESAKEMQEAVRRLTIIPVTTVILTHRDGDHINGLPGFRKGLSLIAHERCKADMVEAAKSMPALADYLPNATYNESRLHLYNDDDGEIELAYFGPAHTSGDTVVVFPREKAAFVGDLVFVGRDPVIHRSKGGRSDGCIRTLEALLEIKPPLEIFLSGHADPAGRAEIEAAVASLEALRSKIKALVDAGKTLADVKKAFGIEEAPAPPGGRRYMGPVETIYLEFTEKK
ncbi:MAG: MBL fold metallo-hydrolase [Candidatus Aminicenantes bacterium]|nr:MBL fold metallo-hydrolase [Candidatus Aminicenantes bacterium]